MQEELEKSVCSMAERLGPPDLLIFSGDLTFQGKKEEFERVDRFLDTVLGWLRAAGAPDPLLVAVPGNHDLQRPPEDEEFRYLILDRYVEAGLDDKSVQRMEERLWEKRDSSPVEPLFTGYQEWFQRRVLPDLEKRSKAIHLSHFPGDFCLELEIDDAFPLCLVGLNSTWQQYKGGDFERKLTLTGRQFQAALPEKGGGSPLEVSGATPGVSW